MLPNFRKLDMDSGNRLLQQKRLISMYNKIAAQAPEDLSFIVFRRKKSKWIIVPFMAVVLLVTLSLQAVSYLSSARGVQGEILGAATTAYADLNSASSNLKNQNFADALKLFQSAQASLALAQNRLDDFKALTALAPQAKSADHVLTGASLLASAGTDLSSALGIFNQIKISGEGLSSELNLTSALKQNETTLKSALGKINLARAEFDAVGELPESYAASIATAREQVSLLSGLLENMLQLEDIYLGMFGDGPKVYLMIFQNYDEVRATGGFIGTYGVLKINDGKIQDLKIDSIYDLDGQIYDQVAAPGPMQPQIKKWGIRDANWFADFPTSARKLLQFFESGSQTADGVIAFTPNMFEELLTLTGPIDMPAYGVTLSAKNFQDVVQYKTSVDYDRTLNEPKKMLADFAPLLLDRLSVMQQEQWLILLQIFENNLNQKQILLYSKDDALQKKIEDARMAGSILATDADYLNIVNTNLGGTKTDLEIKQSVKLESKILSDGSVIDTLTITRLNTAPLDNRDYMRIMVPLGSTLLSAEGFDAGEFLPSEAEGYKVDPDLGAWDQGKKYVNTFVREEAGKTEFAGWLNTTPGEAKTVKLKYVIPYKASSNLFINNVSYSLLFQKQSGIKEYSFEAYIDVGSLIPYWLSPDSAVESGLVKLNYTTKSDQYWALLLRK